MVIDQNSGRIGAQNRWRAILDEYRHDGPPATELGVAEQEWAARHPLPSP